ncbi:MAG: hypothetical protein J0H73_13930 [Salana multivorans]|uniref:minor capsid protein n=1 Tax=Salana multivorans TaxID=120377 RepID=UPI000A52543E|nr:minor capsid protein [Salana multivorans]MBN8883400.1 hypothetical protein [Salana multivorans]
MTPLNVRQATESVAAFLVGEGIAALAPATAGTAITYKRLPVTPDRAIAVTVYDIEDSITLPDVTVLVQLRFRGETNDRTDVDDLADSVAAVLDGRHQFTVGALHVQRARRVSFSPQGADDNGREERADNYALVLMRS